MLTHDINIASLSVCRYVCLSHVLVLHRNGLTYTYHHTIFSSGSAIISVSPSIKHRCEIRTRSLHRTGAFKAGGLYKFRILDYYAYYKQVVSIVRIETICGPPQLPSFHNSFPVIRTANAKNRRFHVPQPTFLFPLETPLRLSRSVLHGWKGNSMHAKPLAACSYRSSIVSELYDA